MDSVDTVAIIVYLPSWSPCRAASCDYSRPHASSVRMLPAADEETGDKVLMRDLLDDKNAWEREAACFRGKHGGLWFDLKPWQAHVFELSFV